MKRLIVFIGVCVFIFVIYTIGFNHGLQAEKQAQIQNATPTPYLLSEDKLWTLINNYRESKSLKPFIKDQKLCDIAEFRVVQLKTKEGDYFNHDGFHELLDGNKIKYAENITGGYSEENALDRWLNSPPHKEAIEAEWKYSCVATGNNYAVQIFSNL